MIICMFSVLVIMIALCVPIGIVLFIASSVPAIMNVAFPVDLEFTIRNIVAGFDNTSLLAIPFFHDVGHHNGPW
jgi:TRAP-type mannitol/chloroaromatic compound transport system permease large subunit